MRVYESCRRLYVRALALRGRMLALHDDLAGRRGWTLVAGILLRRFELAFVRFLDAPTEANCERLMAFQAEMEDLDQRFPNPRPGSA